MPLPAYLLDVAAFLPNAPVDNDHLADVLGSADRASARLRQLILRSNGIRTRYYALDPATGRLTHTNAQLTAAAVRALAPYPGGSTHDLACLCCGTSSPDQLFPGHASMVHGELGNPPCEVVSTSGVCVAGMTALKYACLAVRAGLATNAVATGSELASTFMRATYCRRPGDSPCLEADFLRWMLSDGAGAAWVSPTPPADHLGLRVEWIEIQSFAGTMETCMYAGARKRDDGTLKGWREFSPEEALREGVMLVRQDMKLLNREIVLTSVDRALPPLISRYGLRPEQIDWFVPHYSSAYFRQPIADRLAAIGFDIPAERWFTNLADKGNTGAASIYIMLAELLHSGRLQRGQQLLCFVPESGRFTICYMLLTVV